MLLLLPHLLSMLLPALLLLLQRLRLLLLRLLLWPLETVTAALLAVIGGKQSATLLE
jgi:uncharacterized membrane protein